MPKRQISICRNYLHLANINLSFQPCHLTNQHDNPFYLSGRNSSEKLVWHLEDLLWARQILNQDRGWVALTLNAWDKKSFQFWIFFSEFRMLTYTCVILVLRPKPKTQAHLCFAYTFHTQPEGRVIQYSSVCVLIAICRVRADGEFSSWDIMLVFKRLQIGGHLRFHAFGWDGCSVWELQCEKLEKSQLVPWRSLALLEPKLVIGSERGLSPQNSGYASLMAVKVAAILQ